MKNKNNSNNKGHKEYTKYKALIFFFVDLSLAIIFMFGL